MKKSVARGGQKSGRSVSSESTPNRFFSLPEITKRFRLASVGVEPRIVNRDELTSEAVKRIVCDAFEGFVRTARK